MKSLYLSVDAPFVTEEVISELLKNTQEGHDASHRQNTRVVNNPCAVYTNVLF